MLDYLTTFITVLILYILYYLFRLISFRVVKVFLVCIEIAIVFYFIKSIFDGRFDDIVGAVSAQIVMIIIYVKIYKKDIKRKELYHIISKNNIIAVLISGFTNIEREKIDYAERILKKLFGFERSFLKKYNYLTASYSKNHIEVNIIFWHNEDYNLFVEEKNLEEFDITLENIGRGVAMKCILQL